MSCRLCKLTGSNTDTFKWKSYTVHVECARDLGSALRAVLSRQSGVFQPLKELVESLQVARRAELALKKQKKEKKQKKKELKKKAKKARARDSDSSSSSSSSSESDSSEEEEDEAGSVSSDDDERETKTLQLAEKVHKSATLEIRGHNLTPVTKLLVQFVNKHMTTLAVPKQIELVVAAFALAVTDSSRGHVFLFEGSKLRVHHPLTFCLALALQTATVILDSCVDLLLNTVPASVLVAPLPSKIHPYAPTEEELVDLCRLFGAIAAVSDQRMPVYEQRWMSRISSQRLYQLTHAISHLSLINRSDLAGSSDRRPVAINTYSQAVDRARLQIMALWPLPYPPKVALVLDQLLALFHYLAATAISKKIAPMARPVSLAEMGTEASSHIASIRELRKAAKVARPDEVSDTSLPMPILYEEVSQALKFNGDTGSERDWEQVVADFSTGRRAAVRHPLYPQEITDTLENCV